jgi:uncharacterized RDD family membrane protein YckC
MANLAVKTGFNTNLFLETDTVGKRILAFGIDLLAIGAYGFIASRFLLIFGLNLGADMMRVYWGWISLLSLPVLFYTLISESLSGGYTLGKFIAKIKVVKINGFQPTFVDFFIRWIFRLIDIYIFILVAALSKNLILQVLSVYTIGLVGLLMITRGKRAQRLGDLIAGTTVVRVNQVKKINITIIQNIREDYAPTYSQVLKLSDNDARIIKETYETAVQTSNEVLIGQLVIKMEKVMNVKKEGSDREFIQTVLKDFNYYTQKL